MTCSLISSIPTCARPVHLPSPPPFFFSWEFEVRGEGWIFPNPALFPDLPPFRHPSASICDRLVLLPPYVLPRAPSIPPPFPSRPSGVALLWYILYCLFNTSTYQLSRIVLYFTYSGLQVPCAPSSAPAPLSAISRLPFNFLTHLCFLEGSHTLLAHTISIFSLW